MELIVAQLQSAPEHVVPVCHGTSVAQIRYDGAIQTFQTKLISVEPRCGAEDRGWQIMAGKSA